MEDKPVAIYLHIRNSTFTLDSEYGWDPAWRTVSDIRGWCRSLFHIASRPYVDLEIHANGQMLSQKSLVERSFARPFVILVTPWNPSGYQPIQVAEKIEIYVL